MKFSGPWHSSRLLGGRYRVRHQLGSGGHGRVWEAYDEVLSRRVAIEAVGPAGPEAARAEWLARTVAALDHPNLSIVYDLVEANGVVWCVMPFVPGPSLAEYLAENGRMLKEQVREVAMALCDALAALHEVGVVYGDVRPANVRRTAGGGWMLLPRIGAMARDDISGTVDDERIVATADYIAPELLHGAPQRPSNDLFSLGATLHHLITGSPPFHRDDVMETLAAVAREQPPPLGHIGGLGRLIDELLHKEPELRPTVAQAQRIRDKPPVETYPVGTAAAPYASERRLMVLKATRLSRRLSKHTASATSSLLLLLFLLAATLAGAARAHLAVGDVSDFFVALLPWALFAIGLGVLAVQVRATLTKPRTRTRGPVPVWRWYARSLAPPARWTEEEWARRRAAAERAVDQALLAVDRRVASARPGPGAGGGRTDV
jgi:Protein kinase domain